MSLYIVSIFLNYVWDLIISIWPHIKDILKSPTIWSAVLATVFAPWLAIKKFMQEQRVSRIQKIYYEESLLDQLNHLDATRSIAAQNLALFENGINLILNNLRNGNIASSTVTLLRDIANQISPPIKYESSKKEVLIKLFKKYGYVMYKWLYRFDRDFQRYTIFMRETLFDLAQRLENNSQIQISIPSVRGEAKWFDDCYKLLLRHSVFSFLFNEIISRIGTLTFKTKKKLISQLEKDKEIKAILEKIDETFKTLFGYYELGENEFLSYLQDENGNRFRLNIGDEISITQTSNSEGLDKKKFIIFSDDTHLLDVLVDIDGESRLYSQIQLGMANFCAFNEEPRFYSEITFPIHTPV